MSHLQVVPDNGVLPEHPSTGLADPLKLANESVTELDVILGRIAADCLDEMDGLKAMFHMKQLDENLKRLFRGEP